MPRSLSDARLEVAAIRDWLDRTDGANCVYCGDHAQALDHLVPLPHTGPEWRPYVPTVPSCHECNSILGDYPSPIISERADHLATTYRRRYDLRRAGAERFTDDDLAALDHSLRSLVGPRRETRRDALRRVTVMDAGGAPHVSDDLLLADS